MSEEERRAGRLALDQSDGLSLPRDLLARAGLQPGEEVICETGPEGLCLRSGALRKAYAEITSACNLACATCIRNAWEEPVGHMPVERFRRLLDGLPEHPVTLSLAGFGEPLVHPHFLELVRLARDRNTRVEIITNGTLLDPALVREVIRLGVAQVTVSLDGGDDGAYAAIRGLPLAPALKAIGALVEARRRARRPMEIGVAFVATRRSIGSLPALLGLAREHEVDFVSVSNVVPHTAEMAADMLWQGAAWASSFRSGSWRPRLDVGRMDLDDLTRPALAPIWDRALTWPPPGISGEPRRNTCRFAHEGMLAVSWDGRVAPCLSLLHAHPEFVNGHWKEVKALAVSHVDERDLKDIWGDPEYRKLRERLRAFDFPACFACGGCPETETNETDCYGSPFPACSECLWAQGIVLCP